MIVRFFRSGLLALGLLLLLLVLGLLGWRAVRQQEIRKATHIAVPPGIARLEAVELGGVQQWIQIRGQDTSRPLLLILHGGPGLPEMPYEYVNAGLEKYFIVVEWDQRGAGKSFQPDISGESMRLEQFVNDAQQLTEMLCARFHQKQVFLVGHSSGTVIGMMLAQRAPQLVRAYVGISQIANLQESEKLLYDLTVQSAKAKGDTKALRELAKIGPPPFHDAAELQVSQKWVNHFAPDRFAFLSLDRWRLACASPAYSLLDFVRFFRGAKFSFAHLWRELFATNLFRQIPRVDVPVYFFLGRHDHVVTGSVAEKYFNTLEAPKGKQFFWFEHSAHWPQLEEPQKFQEIMIDRVLHENDG